MCLSIFPFDVWDKLWVLIRSVPEVSLLIKIVSQSEVVLGSVSYLPRFAYLILGKGFPWKRLILQCAQAKLFIKVNTCYAR